MKIFVVFLIVIKITTYLFIMIITFHIVIDYNAYIVHISRIHHFPRKVALSNSRNHA